MHSNRLRLLVMVSLNTEHHLFRAVIKHHHNRLQCQDMAHRLRLMVSLRYSNHHNNINNRRHNSKLQCSKAMDSNNNRHLLHNLDQETLPGKLTA